MQKPCKAPVFVVFFNIWHFRSKCSNMYWPRHTLF